MRVTMLALVGLAAVARGEPKVANPSFEADRYAQWPGYARHHKDTISGWAFTGGAGINPVWEGQGKRPRHAFSDNGRIPHGRQVAFLQNVGSLSQSIGGFEKGKRYRVLYWENARHNNAPDRNPRLKVTLGGVVVVSEHAVTPAEPIDRRTLPYARVESAVFTAPRSGAFALTFETTCGDRVAVLLDGVGVVEVEERPAPAGREREAP